MKKTQLSPATYIFEGKIKTNSGLFIIKDESQEFEEDTPLEGKLFSLIHSGKIFAFMASQPTTFGLKVKYAGNNLSIDGIKFDEHLGRTNRAVIEVKSGLLSIADVSYISSPGTHQITFTEKIASRLLALSVLTKLVLFGIRLVKRIDPSLFSDHLEQKKITLPVPPGNYSVTVHFIKDAEFLGFIVNIKKTLESPLANKVISSIKKFD